MKPVLYLDIDDTLLSWATGEPGAVAGAGDFVRWALHRYEVRWLTRWCPEGEMPDRLLADLAKMIGVDAALLRDIRGVDWRSGTKADGIAWLEHVVMGREFVWLENRDGLSDRDLDVLRQAGCSHRYLACDVTEDEGALERILPLLERRL